MSFVKSLKSTIQKRIIPITLAVSVSVLGNVAHASAATAVDQETLYPILKTSGTTYLYPVTGNSKTVSRYTTITDLLAQYADQYTLNQKTTYTLLNGTFKGYIDGIETSLTSIDTKLGNISGYVDGLETGVTNINTNLTNIKSYVDGLEGYVDNLETYVDNVETLLTTNNTRLNEIKTAINSITTYNYTQVLSDILTNTGYLSTIDTYTQSIQDSIGYGTSGDNVLTKLSSIINHTSNVETKLSNFYDTFSTYDYSIPFFRISQRVGNSYLGNVTFSQLQGNQYPYVINRNSSGYGISAFNLNNGTPTFLDIMTAINSNILSTTEMIYTPFTTYHSYSANYNGGNSTSYGAYSIADLLQNIVSNSTSFFNRLGYVLADDDTIAAKQANQAQEQAVLSSFTGSGSASASASDFGDIASGLNDVKSGINTNVSITNALDVFDSSDGFGWFSNTTLNNLNTVQSTRNRKSANEYSYYNERLNAIYDVMGVKHD